MASIAFVASARPSTGSGSGWRTGKPVVDREHVAPEQPGEDECGPDQRQLGVRTHRQRDRKPGEQHRRDDEADAGTCALVEVRRGESAVDAGADRAGEDDDVDERRFT